MWPEETVCRHSSRGECKAVCASCGHYCIDHGDIGCSTDDGGANGFDCECVEWVEGGAV